jgi:hypothetical protein
MSQMHYLAFNIDLEILHKILHYKTKLHHKKWHCNKSCIAKYRIGKNKQFHCILLHA